MPRATTKNPTLTPEERGKLLIKHKKNLEDYLAIERGESMRLPKNTDGYLDGAAEKAMNMELKLRDMGCRNWEYIS